MEVLQQMMAVALVLALLLGSLAWLRRRGFAGFAVATRRGQERRLECIERLPLGPQHTLLLVRVGEAELLLASSPSGCSLLQTVREVK